MCGIVGILGREPVAVQLVDALKRLEYRGYDSAGVATLEGGRLTRRRAEGKLRNLETKLQSDPLKGTIGIGHTRWATHGRPSESNAHPHATDRLAVVHNGIIENFRELREELEKDGAKFGSETDTEVVAHLVTREMKNGRSPADAVPAALPRLRGAFALAFLFEGEENLLIGARKGSPLAIGYGDGEMYLGSDAIALAPFTDTVAYLEDGDSVVISRTSVEIRDAAGSRGRTRACTRRRRRRSWSTRATIAISWRRRFTSSRRSSATRWRTTSTWRPSRSPAGGAAVRLQEARPDFDLGLRHRLLCGAGREILVRALCPAAGRDRRRVRIPLPRGAAERERARDLRVAVGRDRRHAGDAALREGAQAAHHFGGQRADLDHRARKRRGVADAGRSGDRRRLDQGVHLSACRARLASRSPPAARAVCCRPTTSASWCGR